MDKKERKLMALGVLEFVNMLNDADESGYVEKGESMELSALTPVGLHFIKQRYGIDKNEIDLNLN